MLHIIVCYICRSNGAYEALRDSGFFKLPSQRTLRDYTHYIEAKCGFSVQVDCMLQKTAKNHSCPERDKCVILLVEEMYIKEDLVYNKHSGEMVGFTNLGSINDHLADFERSLTRGHESNLSLAKTMVCLWCEACSLACSFLMFILPAQASVETRCMILYGKLFGE